MGSIDKPHIRRAQPYDGDGWICFGKGANTNFGSTPVEAFRNWNAERAEHCSVTAEMLYHYKHTYA